MKSPIAMLLCTSAAILAGCNQQESPAEVREDVAEVRQEAREELAEVRNESRDLVGEVTEQASEPAIDGATPGATISNQGDPTEVAAVAQYRLDVARAEAQHRIQTEKCEALPGDQQSSCKEAADQRLERAREMAEAQRQEQG